MLGKASLAGYSSAHSLSIPAHNKACHYGRSSSTSESYYHLADDWDNVEALQDWDHMLEDCHTDNSANNSRNRVLEGII